MAESAAGQAAATMLAERDAIQTNLLELDGGFTRRLLDGATLTGQTRERWDPGSATLAGLWETYLAYSAVVDRVAELGTGAHRPARKDLPELDSLLTGASVRMESGTVPLARRNLSDAGVPGGGGGGGPPPGSPSLTGCGRGRGGPSTGSMPGSPRPAPPVRTRSRP